MPARDVAVVVVAAGRGERLGAGAPKAFVKLGQRTLLEHTIDNISQMASVSRLVLAVPASHVIEATAMASASAVPTSIVIGGDTRQQSIENALQVLEPGTPIVLVHDAARSLAPAELFERVAASVRESGLATIPVMPVTDTVKHVLGDLVLETVDRSSLRLAQTPQGFQAFELLAAYQSASEDFTDDAALVQSLGGQIRHVAGDARAFKITTMDDLAAAERLLTAVLTPVSQPTPFVGIGIDVHRFSDDPEKPLYLGCLLWPGEIGLDGHSDGDAIAHALVDSLLSAAGLGDIGTQFGVDRPEYAGASGELFIVGTINLLSIAGFKVNNVAVEIVGNRPKLNPRRKEVEARLTELVGAPVTLAATTTDGLGFLGHSEGLAAVANASIVRLAS
jgi:2-C-methyl-D-erythritol 4-phosphate cytidylyltransferase/2-C-methyl-D-erythritol 2,4-cyclodiphosphate synthase